LQEAIRLDREGSSREAEGRYQAAIALSESNREHAVLAEALRRLGVLRHRANNPAGARELCTRSYETARTIADDLLAAEALNALAGFEMEAGAIDQARLTFERALTLSGGSALMRGRIEQNLGILANIQGDLEGAVNHYEHSLQACQNAGEQRGCAFAYHNLGMVSADRKRWEEADRYFRQSHDLADTLRDRHLQGLCLLNHAEVHLARQRYDDARRSAEQALAIFDELHSHIDKADAYKMLGVVFREIGRPALAESRLRVALELAASAGSVLSEAEASRELALLHQALGRNQEALQLLTGAHRLFRRLNAHVDLVDVAGKVAQLESTYLAIVRDWGQSIESADSYTHGHCERVAEYGQTLAAALGLGEEEQTALRLGAYLHDLGKVRVPHEILNKPGRLTPEEFEIIKQHPVWGVELLAGIEFPWDIKPIIRWHHEKYDGSGYPDRLRGDEIPLSAQIICVVDVYDALTTTRSYRGAMDPQAALAEMVKCRHWWRSDVFEAFCSSLPCT
jgi:putative nucleotidyltransferase with HDIG domain